MPRIFISYSRRDKTIAEYIAAQLRNRGAEVFIDYQKLVGGENFIERLGGEIARSDYLVLLLSPRSVDSPWVQAEVAWAFTNRKPIVPVLLETSSIVSMFFLANLEQIDFTRWNLDGRVGEAVIKLATALSLPTAPLRAEPVPALTTRSEPAETNDEPQEREPVVFPRGDLSELFFTAAEVADDDPEQAMFLYRQVIDIDPDYMRGQAQAFVDREIVRLKPIRLARMLERAHTAMRAGRWQQAEQIGQDMVKLDNKNADAQAVIQACKENAPGEPVYQQIVIAVQRKRIRAAETLLRDFRQTYPTYGDPARLVPAAWPVKLPLLEWCEIPAGQVVIEGQTYSVPAFQISKYPVTNAQYAAFINHPFGYADPVWWAYSPEAQAWRAENPQAAPGAFTGDKRPRENVSWYEAVAFCRWLAYMIGEHVTLPTEQQWQWAAQGNTAREYPWDGPFDANKCNTKESGIGQTTDVDRYPDGASPFGVMDMAGNVWEWCLNEYENPENTGLGGDARRVLRGGAWYDLRDFARAAYRDDPLPRDRLYYDGFRVLRPPSL